MYIYSKDSRIENLTAVDMKISVPVVTHRYVVDTYSCGESHCLHLEGALFHYQDGGREFLTKCLYMPIKVRGVAYR
jgi:hypothetical protein